MLSKKTALLLKVSKRMYFLYIQRITGSLMKYGAVSRKRTERFIVNLPAEISRVSSIFLIREQKSRARMKIKLLPMFMWISLTGLQLVTMTTMFPMKCSIFSPRIIGMNILCRLHLFAKTAAGEYLNTLIVLIQ